VYSSVNQLMQQYQVIYKTKVVALII